MSSSSSSSSSSSTAAPAPSAVPAPTPTPGANKRTISNYHKIKPKYYGSTVLAKHFALGNDRDATADQDQVTALFLGEADFGFTHALLRVTEDTAARRYFNGVK